MFLVGSVETHTILRSYIRSYHFYDPSAILIVLMRWDRKIVQSYNPDRDFNSHASNILAYNRGGRFKT